MIGKFVRLRLRSRDGMIRLKQYSETVTRLEVEGMEARLTVVMTNK